MSNLDTTMLKKMADTIRFLSADMIQKANSGHPGAPMGLADILSVLSLRLNHNPKDPSWLNRDRLVFSGGHASALIYSWLHLSGYPLSIDDLKNFRQFGSKTPGHPEKGHPMGVEITTGPLGQGVANAVGFSIASKQAKNMLDNAIDHKVYCFCGDGDIQEGIGYEAFSLAGHLALDNLVVIYDNNHITIEGDTSLAFSENVEMRFKAQNWDVITINGHDYAAIEAAFEQSNGQNKPLLIIANTKIAKGAATKEGSHKTHGSPLGDEEIEASKKLAGFEPSEQFIVPADVKARFECALERGESAQNEWKKSLSEEQKNTLLRMKNPDFNAVEFPVFETGSAVATRDSNGKIINAIAKGLEGFFGGSADLAPSNKTELEGMGSFPEGRNIRFGIREHSMAAITNAIAAYGAGFLPFCSTFFVFSDYQTPSLRMAALMGLKNYFIWTHDSIGVGEDGATHQPIEHLSQVRALPGFYTYRPADANENIACWKDAFMKTAPCGFVLTRQKLPTLAERAITGDVSNGGYLLKEENNAKITLIASGSEVSLALEAAKKLDDEGIKTNVISTPCFDTLLEQDKSYLDSIFKTKTTVAIEAARGLEWYRFADHVIGIDSFGHSAPAGEVFEHFGLTPEKVVTAVKECL